jgi:serine/threonine protein kinase
MANGSLADCLAIKGKHGGLTCSKRVRIAHDIAKALLYIHTFPGCPMLHLNIKSCNILLGESFIAKLGDFGIALRLRGQGETKSRSRTQLNTKSQYMTLTGTYLPPEYIRGKVSAALDVYAFGVVLLEIMTGQKTVDSRREIQDLTSYMNDFLDAIDDDQSLVLACRDARCSNWPDEEFIKFAKLAKRCLGDRLKRPSSESIARDLERLYAFIQPLEGSV